MIAFQWGLNLAGYDDPWRKQSGYRDPHAARGLTASRSVPSMQHPYTHQTTEYRDPHYSAVPHSRSLSTVSSAAAAANDVQPYFYVNAQNKRYSTSATTATRPASRHVRSKSNPLDFIPSPPPGGYGSANPGYLGAEYMSQHPGITPQASNRSRASNDWAATRSVQARKVAPTSVRHSLARSGYL